jgi:hypothetical protein
LLFHNYYIIPNWKYFFSKFLKWINWNCWFIVFWSGIIYERTVSTPLMPGIKIDHSDSFQSITDPMVMKNDKTWVKLITYMKHPTRYQKKFGYTLIEIECQSILMLSINALHIFSYMNVLKITDNYHFIMFWYMWNLPIDAKLTQLSSR